VNIFEDQLQVKAFSPKKPLSKRRNTQIPDSYRSNLASIAFQKEVEYDPYTDGLR
jgi:hypothetical protein